MFSHPAFSPFGLPDSQAEWPTPFVQSLLDFTGKLQATVVKLQAENAQLGEQALQQAETIRELRDEIYAVTGVPKPIEFEDKVVALIEYRDGSIIDVVRQVRA